MFQKGDLIFTATFVGLVIKVYPKGKNISEEEAQKVYNIRGIKSSSLIEVTTEEEEHPFYDWTRMVPKEKIAKENLVVVKFLKELKPNTIAYGENELLRNTTRGVWKTTRKNKILDILN